MKKNLNAVCALIFLMGTWLGQANEKPNILFIAIDDLRVELGCYGSEIVRSPNIDALASSGIRFDQAYCQQAICGPSRASVMTGLRPDAVQVHGNHTHFREIYPDLVTLPQHFKNHGYHTRSMGKLYHGVFPKGASITKADTFGDEPSWSIPTFRPGPRYYYTEKGIEAAKEVYQRVYKPSNPGPDDWTQKLVFGLATEAPDVDDDVLYDGQVAERAVASLQELAESEEAFFLAVGFIKPHSPFIAPKKYWDLYDEAAIPLAAPATRETDAPTIGRHGSLELRRYTDQRKKGSIPEADQRRVRHAYYACISYIDAQIGRVLDELRDQDLADNTIVVLWSDHGYHLGEKNLWGKKTNFELDTRVPLIVRVPGEAPGVHGSPVELVDLYPTLADLAGLPVEAYLQGTSLVPAIKNPETPVKRAAYSQFSTSGKRGYSMREGNHRYTEWIDLKTGQVVERLLFDLEKDPHETTNLVASSDDERIASLSALLDRGKGWREARVTPELTLGWPFTDHMVLQREQRNQIWGTGPPGSMVSMAAPWGMLHAQVNSTGEWKMEIPPLGESVKPLTLKFQCGEESLELENVVFGDVWICSGQSNMRWMLKDTEGAEEAIAQSANPDLRILNLASTIHPGSGRFPLMQLRSTFADNLLETDGWQIAGPDTVPKFSGVAYYFGQRVQRETGVPIGLIQNGVGGSPMESWIPGREVTANWLEDGDLPRWCRERAALNLTHWSEKAVAPTPHHPFEPGFLFDAGIDPLTGLGAKGVIWYQGESNATSDGSGSPAMDPKKNFALHKELIESWRSAWGSSELPFYFVQLPGLNRDWSAFREIQSQIDLLLPNTHMAVTLDLGHPTNVHPKNKRPVGERLANLALRHSYGKNLRSEAPRFMGWVNREDSIELRFSRPVKLKGSARVAVAGEDRKFRQIEVSMWDSTGLRLLLNPVDPRVIESVRYAWENDPGASIVCAETNLPVAPFRTDDWPMEVAQNSAPTVTQAHAVGVSRPGNLTSFEGAAPSEIEQVDIGKTRLLAKPGNASVVATHAYFGKQCLRLLGGEDREVVLHLRQVVPKGSIFGFQAERWTRRDPFRFEVFARSESDAPWKLLYDGSRGVKVGRAFLSPVRIKASFDFTQVKFVSTTPEGSGVLIDDLQIIEPKPMKVVGMELQQKRHPVLIGKDENAVLGIVVSVEGTTGKAPVVSGFSLSSEGTDDLDDIESMRVLYSGSQSLLTDGQLFGEPSAPAKAWTVSGEQTLSPGENYFWVSYQLKPSASLEHEVDAGCLSLTLDGVEQDFAQSSPAGAKRIGYALRQQGQDGVNSARIPGLATTNEGTLIAVYDNRNRARGDLPGDIDVGMNRSTDGGQTWSSMRVIMDMGDDPKWNYEGIGDPAILVDRITGTIWVAATWSHGNRSWNGSGPGLEPEDTGQLMLVKSNDDGLTWSEPINITKQVKDPKWRFVLQGPGKGITMSDGTLVFPAQFRGENREPVNGKPFSTLIYSKDRGKTWKIGTGVKIDTTEAQLVELGDGSIMINCRDNRGGSRSVHTTTDLGKTWKEHPTSRSALPEPVCMASLIRVETKAYGPLLFFSNPPQANGRRNMTIKVSDDEGLTWPEKWHTLVDERFTAYSCMTPVGENHIGLVYEAPGELYFVRYSIEELLRK